MKWLRSLLSLSALCAAIGFATAPAGAQPVPVYAKGYKAPANLKAMMAASDAAHADTITSLPRATETKFNCNDLLGPVKGQGRCGSCWSFAGIGTCEGAFARVGKRLVLSEQYILDCVDSGGCNGDDFSTVYKHAQRHGVPATMEYGPYRGGEGRCQAKDGMEFFKIESWGYVDSQNEGVADTQKIKDCLKAYGPVGSAVAADDVWQRYTGGIHKGRSVGPRDIDHEVIIVGWDDTLVPGKTVWDVRNSWTKTWGTDGRMLTVEKGDGIGWTATFVKAAGSPPPPVPPVPPGPTPPSPTIHNVGAYVAGLLTGLLIGACVLVVFATRRKS